MPSTTYIFKVAVEAICVGVAVVVVGTAVSFLLSLRSSSSLPEVCRSWNDAYIMETALFLTGVSVHLLCEVVGLNTWYITNGAALAYG